MDVRTDSEFFDAVASESGLLAEQSPRPDSAILEYLRLFYGLKGKLTRIPTEKDETFRLQEGNATYLVKLSSADEDPQIVHFQTACMEHLERASPELPVQRLVRSLSGEPEVHIPPLRGSYAQVLRVMHFMPGTLLANHAPTGGQLRSYGSSLALLGLALENFDHSHDDRLLMWDLKHFHRMRPLLRFVDDKDKRSLAEGIFDQFDEKVVPLLGSLTTQVIHGDFSPFNVLVDPNAPDFVTGIIDFGDAVRTPVIFDLSVAMANQLGTEPNRPWERALNTMDGFRSLRPLPIQEWEALSASAPARLLLRALITQWRASQLPQRRDYLLSHSKSDWDRLASAATAPAQIKRLIP
ncbi:Ser/Thr protein kinase RdoA (MazF antagonist) [Pseudarthrobacter sp. PvP004]|uniref:phosphotransferase n=1 Tax=Pseudarthrobacter sp. PvP004 TaxID=2817850 RepID=UPI001AE9AD3D|nr:phosphotransferase [Pseudarthrobacter sp. PvP004]MBP2267788.1 Ser/Thr protein kinase RdoA (MazF antagonist) [Pseudarthrobacter sp. PvP004]